MTIRILGTPEYHDKFIRVKVDNKRELQFITNILTYKDKDETVERLFFKDGRGIYTFRGYREYIKYKAEMFGISLYDQVEEEINHGVNINKNILPGKTLFDFQIIAVRKALAKKYGVIVSPVGSGKTVMAMAIMKHHSLPSIIVTPSTYLEDQFLSDMRKHGFDQVERASKVKNDLPNYIVGTWKSVLNLIRNHSDHISFYKCLILDECLAKGTLVVLEDGGIKKIEDIKDGDEVLGGKVSNCFSRSTNDVYKVKTNIGEIICTGTHKHLVVLPCSRTREPIIMTTEELIEYMRTHKYKPYFLSPAKVPHVTKNNFSREQLGFIALILMDGTIEESGRIKVMLRKSDKIKFVREVFTKGVKSFGIDKPIKESINSRGDWTIWVNSKELVRILREEFKIPSGRKVNYIDIADSIFYAPIESIKEFINVAFCCDGDLNKNKNNAYRLSLNSTSKNFIYKFRLLLLKLGIYSYVNKFERKSYKHACIYRLTVGNNQLNELFEQINFYRYNNSIRNKSTADFDKKVDEFYLVRILSIEKLNKDIEVYDFTVTPSHRFVANGIWTHNCQHAQAKTWRELIVNMCHVDYMIGFTGTLFRDIYLSYNNLNLQDFITIGVSNQVICEIPHKILIKEGFLAEPVIYVEEIRSPMIRGKWWHAVYKKGIINNKYRNKRVVHFLEEFAKRDLLVMGLTSTITHVRRVADLISQEFKPYTFIYTGGRVAYYWDGLEWREFYSGYDELADLIESGKVKILLATTVFNEGINIPRINAVVLMYAGKAITRFLQQIGRALRVRPDKKKAFIVDMLDATHPYLFHQYKRREKFYEKAGFRIVRRYYRFMEEVDEFTKSKGVVD